MRVPRPKLNQSLQIDGREIELISGFIYLGSMIDTSNKITIEIKRRKSC